MKRDLDLVRKIMLALEAYDHGYAPEGFTIAGYDDEVIGHHVWLMAQGGLLTALTSPGEASPIAEPGSITWVGHEWLAVVRNERVWVTVRTEMKDRGLTLSFALMQELAIKIAKSFAGLD